VNNAATTQFVAYTDLDGMSSDIWDRIFAVNVKGVFFCCREAIKRMKRQGKGSIVSVSSIAGMTGLGSSIAYAASKAAIINMTRGLAASCAPEISVNAVAPGVVETRWIEGWEEFTDPHKDATPMKRHATPHDVALAIYGLILNPFTTGETIRVDGGRTLGAT
jgi:3-oxoacyl-[acyl-carrier protein] reductase